MFNFQRAALHAARFGISAHALRVALQTGDLEAGNLPNDWAIEASALEAWCDRQ